MNELTKKEHQFLEIPLAFHICGFHNCGFSQPQIEKNVYISIYILNVTLLLTCTM